MSNTRRREEVTSCSLPMLISLVLSVFGVLSVAMGTREGKFTAEDEQTLTTMSYYSALAYYACKVAMRHVQFVQAN